ncbi:hypothetical protein BJ508DRAFT_420031 [Ascobolus immersus RN42]|uniref:Uncharacterized protein n=1 Tax=Ascobolus immersus RN42 TaxID=1160509 RepID=A0A3N4HCS2_ASCIM|nr:hypothetical protein BJ508DRAFT_420031 [Ascobolus immersus RN42]
MPDPIFKQPPGTIVEFKQRLKQAPMHHYDPGNIIQNPNRTTNDSKNRITDYIALYSDDSGIHICGISTHFQNLFHRWKEFHDTCRDGRWVGKRYFGMRNNYSSHMGAWEKLQESRRVSMIRQFWDRLVAGLARRKQLDLVWLALGLWKQRTEEWLDGLDPEDGREWKEDLEVYEKIHVEGWGMVVFFMDLRSESIETRIWKHMNTGDGRTDRELVISPPTSVEDYASIRPSPAMVTQP